jgi:hypothetical protein
MMIIVGLVEFPDRNRSPNVPEIMLLFCFIARMFEFQPSEPESVIVIVKVVKPLFEQLPIGQKREKMVPELNGAPLNLW